MWRLGCIAAGTMNVMVSRVIVSDPEIMSGTPCFRGTRVPFQNLMDYLEGGHSLGEFLEQFPSVSREDAIQSLEEAKESLLLLPEERGDEEWNELSARQMLNGYQERDAIYDAL